MSHANRLSNPDTRPLPPGFIDDYDASYGAWFYVNTMVNPLQVSWNHPLDVKPSVPGVGPSGSAIQMPEPQPFVNGSDFHTLPQSVTPRAISQQPVLTNEDKTRSVTTSTKEVLKQARAALQSSSKKNGGYSAKKGSKKELLSAVGELTNSFTEFVTTLSSNDSSGGHHSGHSGHTDGGDGGGGDGGGGGGVC